MNNSALAITGERPTYSITIIPDAIQAKADALELSRQIKAVTSAEEQQNAVAAASIAKGLIKRMEATREAEKRPFWDVCVIIDSTSKSYKKELQTEVDRVEGLAANYQREQDRLAAEAKAAEERQFKALREAEERAIAEIAAKADAERRANLAAIAAATDEAAKEAAQRKADADAEARSEEVRINCEAIAEQERRRLTQLQAITPTRPDGARVVRTWDYTITDIALLALERPDLVTIEPKRSLLIAAAAIPGIKIPGVTFHEVTKVQSKAS